MYSSEYQTACKRGMREVREAASRGEPTGLLVLPDAPEKLAYSRETLGIVEVPVELIVGTCSQQRADSFSPKFSPILPANSEFAKKWLNLCSMHLEEGIRDAIRVVEYLNRYYVVEGHKRVSVLRHFGAVSIPGHVTRLIPYPSQSPEVLAYQEFLAFYRMTGQLCLVYRQPGQYTKLIKAMQLPVLEAWGAEDNQAFRGFYYMFRDAFLKMYGQEEKVSQGFLTYVEIFGYSQSLNKLPVEIEKDLEKIEREIRSGLDSTESTLMLEDNAKAPLLSVLRPSKVKVAFVHDDYASQSQWVYSQEYGRYRMAHAMRDQVETWSYENANSEEKVLEAVEDAVKKGAKIIFTTRSTMLLPTVKEAVLHSDVKFLNCSLNTNYPSVRTYFPRLYGAKFIKGVVAGTLAKDGQVGYVSNYPTFGSIANVNAFAQGVQLVNANAKVHLEWSQLQEGDGVQRLYDRGIRLIDYRDRLGLYTGMAQDRVHNMALIQYFWGRMYQSLVRRVMDGSWKQEESGNSSINYWWGMSQGVVSVLCSRRVSSGTRRLVGVLRDALRNERMDPFYGTLFDQAGNVVRGEDTPMTAQQIMKMNWLSSNVVGRLPQLDEFKPKGQELLRMQGLEGWNLP